MKLGDTYPAICPVDSRTTATVTNAVYVSNTGEKYTLLVGICDRCKKIVSVPHQPQNQGAKRYWTDEPVGHWEGNSEA